MKIKIQIYLAIIVIINIFSCSKTENSGKNRGEWVKINDSVKVFKFKKDSLTYQEIYYLNNFKYSIYTRNIYNQDTIEQFLKSRIKELNLYDSERYKNGKLDIKGTVLLDDKNKNAFRDPIKIYWNSLYNDREKKEETFYYYDLNGYIKPYQFIEYKNTEINKNRSHFFNFKIENNVLKISLISCCIETKILYLSKSNDENYKKIISNENNEWSINSGEIESYFSGYIEIEDSTSLPNNKLDFLNNKTTYFMENIQNF